MVRDSWLYNDLSVSISKQVYDYLSDLKHKLEIVADEALEYSDKQQLSYAHYRNRKSKDKAFDVGEEVLVFIPSSTNALFAHWIGPCKVTRKLSNHSYEIETDEGKRIHLHANKMRKFHRRVAVLGVIHEEDEDFGEVMYAPTNADSRFDLSPKTLSADSLKHLSQYSRKDLLQL